MKKIQSRIIEIEMCEYSIELINEIADVINSGKIVIMPSDTIYGFLTLDSQSGSLQKIKKRDNKPFLNLISDLAQLEQLGIDKNKYIQYLKKYWPGPVTFILMNNHDKRIGVRMPDHYAINAIISKVNKPLISTSVNYCGESEINDIDEIIKEFSNKVDLIIVDRNFKPGNPSTIADISKKYIKILRKGSVDIDNEI